MYDTDYANLESSLTQFTIIADIYLQIRFFLLIHVYHIESNFKKRFGAIIATLYVPAGIQISLLVNLTLFHWAGWGEGQSA